MKVAEDEDFTRLKNLCDVHEDWKLEYSKSSTNVWTRSTEQTEFKMIKMRTVYKDVKASVVFDVLHDPSYRKIWDSHMLESYDIGCLNPNNDVGYYAMRCPSPLKNRDFVLQRSWLDTGNEFLLLNHSVYHKSLPPKKGYIRAFSYLTGFVVRPSGISGAELSYVTQSDPRGSLPPWIVNKLTHVFAPKMLKRMHKACLGYEAWKMKHSANYKPWLYPEQITLPRLNLAECLQDIDQSSESLDDTEDVVALEESEFSEIMDVDEL